VRVRSLASDVAVQQPDGRLGTHPVEEAGQVLGHLWLRVADALHAVAPRRAIDLHLGPTGAEGDRRGRQREAAVIGPEGIVIASHEKRGNTGLVQPIELSAEVEPSAE